MSNQIKFTLDEFDRVNEFLLSIPSLRSLCYCCCFVASNEFISASVCELIKITHRKHSLNSLNSISIKHVANIYFIDVEQSKHRHSHVCLCITYDRKTEKVSLAYVTMNERSYECDSNDRVHFERVNKIQLKWSKIKSEL